MHTYKCMQMLWLHADSCLLRSPYRAVVKRKRKRKRKSKSERKRKIKRKEKEKEKKNEKDVLQHLPYHPLLSPTECHCVQPPPSVLGVWVSVSTYRVCGKKGFSLAYTRIECIFGNMRKKKIKGGTYL